MILLACLPLLAAPLRTEGEVIQEVLARIDTDRDGVISSSEYGVVDPTGAFADLDADADGGIDAAELAAWVKRTQPRETDGAPPPAEAARRPTPAPVAAPTGLNPWLAGGALAGGLGLGLVVGLIARRRR